MRKLACLVLFMVGLAGTNIAHAETLTADGLRQAARSGDLATIQRYIAAKFDLNKVSGGVPALRIEGGPAIAEAAANKQCAAVRLLLEGGARADTGKKYGFTPLALAAQAGAVDCVKALLEKRARIDVRTEANGDTPLILAAYAGHLDVVKLLVAAGANKTIKNKDGDSALGAAKTMGNASVVAYLQNPEPAKPIAPPSHSLVAAKASKQVSAISPRGSGPLKDGYIMCASEEALNNGTQLVIQGKGNMLRSIGCYSTSSTIEGAVLNKGFTKSEVLLKFPSGDSATVWVHSEAIR